MDGWRGHQRFERLRPTLRERGRAHRSHRAKGSTDSAMEARIERLARRVAERDAHWLDERWCRKGQFVCANPWRKRLTVRARGGELEARARARCCLRRFRAQVSAEAHRQSSVFRPSCYGLRGKTAAGQAL